MSKKFPLRHDEPQISYDRIEGNRIILDGKGRFPKPIMVNLGYGWIEYRLIKTGSNKLLLMK